ncbi:MAG TPA: hypothetical protein VMM81_00325 [Acidimicrobiia bacterium]|nr:hypothetical protein [Acidimicrobiia bacterium]
MTCPSCSASDAIQIELTMPDASEVMFNSCHRCEHRWWVSNAEVIGLESVLEMARNK